MSQVISSKRKKTPIFATHQMRETALALSVALNVNIILWGPPGSGKTSVLKSIAKAFDFHLEVLLISTKEPSEIAGIPYIAEGIEKTAAPEYVRKVLGAYKGTAERPSRRSMVFWDEFSTGLPATQAATLTTILDRKAGPFQMPMDTRMIAAANPPKIAANGWDLSAPTANRFTHLDWELDAITIANGFQNGWEAPAIPLLPSPDVMQTLIRNAEILMGAFVRAHPTTIEVDFSNYRGNASKDKFMASDNAFPTARSLEVAATIYAGGKVARFADGTSLPEEITTILLEGTIGVNATIEFMNFARSFDLPDPRTILNNPETFEIPDRSDKISALLSSVQAQAILFKSSKQYNIIWQHWGNALARIIDEGHGDVALLSAQRWLKEMPANGGLTKRHNDSISPLLNAYSD